MATEKKKKSEPENGQEGAEGTVQQPEKPAETKERDLAAELEAAKAEAEDNKRKWYSVTAEYENYRKRTASQSAQRYAEGRADVVKGLFPIADNLERALAGCREEATKKGIEMVLASFEKLLEEERIETVCPVGEEFDAEECEAIMAVEPEEGETSGTVRSVYRKGYRQGNRMLRFAQVVVIK